MQRATDFARYWLPAVLWMGLIFWGSSSVLSSGATAPLFHRVFLWFLPNLTPPTLELLTVLLRKCAHLAEYAILAALIWRGLHRPGSARARAEGWNWRQAWTAAALASAYAATDEIHQAFVPTRQGSVVDVIVDTAGAFSGMYALGRILIWRSSRTTDKQVD